MRSIAVKGKALLEALATVGGIAAVVVGLPLALVRVVDWSVVTETTSLQDLWWEIQSGSVTTEIVIIILAVVLWWVWLQLVVALVIEVVATIRGIDTPDLAGLRTTQRVIGPLVARLALSLSTLTSTAALAVPMPMAPIPEPVVSVEPASAEGPGIREWEQPDVSARDSSVVDVVVGSRDTFRSLADRYLGSPDSWHEIRDNNIGVVMADGTPIAASTVRVAPGTSLAVPTTVVEGDHLWGMAKERLTEVWGRTPTNTEIDPYWRQVVDQNRDDLLPPGDPDLIYPGQAIQLPEPPTSPDLGPVDRLAVGGSDTSEPGDQHPLTGAVDTSDVADPAKKATITRSGPNPAARQTEAVAAPPTTEPTEMSADASLDNKQDLVAPVLFAGLGTVGAAMLGAALLRRRRHQIARRPEDTIVSASPAAEQVEYQIRSLDRDHEASRYITALNPWLSKTMATATELPSLIAIRAGDFGLELLLDEPHPMDDNWVALAESQQAWRLKPDIPVHQLEQDGIDCHPFAPALLPAGDTPVGELFIDVEQLAAITVEGPPDIAHGTLRSFVVGALASPWLSRCELVAIDVPGITESTGDIMVPTDPISWAQQTTETHRDRAVLKVSPYEQRVRFGQPDPTTVVFIGSTGAGVAQHLLPIAMLAHSNLVVLAATDLSEGYRITLTDRTATLEPFGLEWEPRTSSIEDVQTLLGLWTETATDPRPPPALTGEPEEPNRHRSRHLTVTSVEEREQPSANHQDLTPSPSTVARVEALAERGEIHVKLLCPIPVLEGVELQPKKAAVLAYIAVHPGTARTKIADLFFDGKTDTRAIDNTLSAIRKAVGPERFPKANTYTIDGVTVDWTAFGRLVDEATQTATPSDRLAVLMGALELVEGAPGQDAPLRNWSWLTEVMYRELDQTIIDTAAQAANLALDHGDGRRAQAAIRIGKRVNPQSEILIRLDMNAANAAGDRRSIDNAYHAAVEAAEADEVELSEVTHNLYQHLIGPRLPTLQSTGTDGN